VICQGRPRRQLEPLKSAAQGSERLSRQDLEFLAERLAAIPGLEDLAMTSNGFLFPQKGKS